MEASTLQHNPTASSDVQLDYPAVARKDQRPAEKRSRVTIKNYYPLGEKVNADENINNAQGRGDQIPPEPSTEPVNPYDTGYDQTAPPAMETRRHTGYEQGRLPTFLLEDLPRSNWPSQSLDVSPDFRPDSRQETVSDLRGLAIVSIFFNPGFGVAALLQAIKARKELENGNIARAKEHNSNALGFAIAAIAISFFVGAAIVVQRLFLQG